MRFLVQESSHVLVLPARVSTCSLYLPSRVIEDLL